MSTTISPNMLLPIPVVGSEAGPQYATDINNSLTIVDQHDHSNGSGVQITPSGLNINSDLSIGSNNLTTIRSVRFQSQNAALSGSSDLGCLFEVGVDLYYRDGNGNAIRITQSGSVAGSSGTITGLPSGTASAAYSLGTFTFQSATNTAANIDGASFVLRNNTASSKGLTLQPPNAMGSDYSLTLPPLPASQKIMTLDASGNITAPYVVDNSTIQIATNTIQIKDLGVTAAKLAPKPNAGSTAAAGEVAVSASCGTFSTSSAPFVDVTNLSVTITSASGRPIRLVLMTDAAVANDSSISAFGGGVAKARFVDSGVTTSYGAYQWTGTVPAFLETFDFTLTAGSTRTYKFQTSLASGSSVIILDALLMAYEI